MLCELAAGCGLNFYLLDANFVNTVSFCGKNDGKSSVQLPKKLRTHLLVAMSKDKEGQ